jgi:hypothetical protein
VEIVGKNRVIAGFSLWRVTFFNSKTPLWQFTKNAKIIMFNFSNESMYKKKKKS